MKKILISFIFFVMCFTVLGVVHALNIPVPTITGVEYPSGTSLKIKYNSNNTNSNYQILLYNMTSGELVKQSVNTSSYTFTGLETGKVYNFKARVYYLENNKPQLSAWSNIVSASPKAGDVKISSITGDNTKAVINYSVTASPVGVEIYVKELGKSFRTTNLSTYTLTGLTNGKTYTVTMRTYYENGATGDWSDVKSVVPTVATTIELGKATTKSSKIFLNYSVKGSPKGVQIHVSETNKTHKTTDLKKYTITGLTNNKKYTITARTYYSDGTYGAWTTPKTVKLETSSEYIARTAEEIAWPINTSRSVYHHNYAKSKKWTKWSQLGKARPTKAFQNAYDQVRSWHWTVGSKKYGYYTRIGASCDVFVGTSVRYSGYDKSFPFCLGSKKGYQLYHLKHSKKWKKVSKAKRGDICYKSTHVKIYLGNGKKAEAGYYTKRFGKIYKGGCKGYTIYRATQ